VEQIQSIFREQQDSDWPGIGLLQAYVIAQDFYGGLHVSSDGRQTAVLIGLETRT
jgi:hypothetical protein